MHDRDHDNIPTIVISRKPGVTSSALFWPRREPSDVKWYRFDVSQHVRAPIERASVSVKPSGMGEMQPLELFVEDNKLIVSLAGGVAGRKYIVCVCYETEAEQESWLITLPVDNKLISYPPIYAPSPSFGRAVTWPTIIGWAGFPIFGHPYMPQGPTPLVPSPMIFGRF